MSSKTMDKNESEHQEASTLQGEAAPASSSEEGTSLPSDPLKSTDSDTAESVEVVASEDSTNNTDSSSEESKQEEIEMDLEPPTPEELITIRKEAAKAQENWEKYLRVSADFENFKKRSAKDRMEAIKYANEALLELLIPVADNFEMALQAVDSAPENNAESLKIGVEMIRKQLKTVMEDYGLMEINASNQEFDPTWHEAVSQEETDQVEEGHIVRQTRKGYKLRDRLIRAANVVVAKKPEPENKNPEEQNSPK
jgi:molecular chaperone GrpE